MILVCGSAEDRVTGFFCKRLDALGSKYQLVDLSCYPTGYRLSQRRGGLSLGSISSPSGSIRTPELTGVFVRDLSRWDDWPDARLDPDLSVALHAERTLGLESFWAELDCVVVNPFTSNWSNQSKPYQTLIIGNGLFEIPKTLITNDARAARRFHEQMRGRIIYKSSSGRSFGTRAVDSEALSRLLLTRDTPVQLQARVPGVDIRVHVVRDQIFATRIHSEAIDYRWAENEPTRLETCSLPASVRCECIRIAEQFGLLFSGIDLRETSRGRYYCFEVNPAPDFAFYEERTGQEISAALRDLLSRG